MNMAVMHLTLQETPYKISMQISDISEFIIQSCDWPPQFLDMLLEILELLILHVLANDACKFAINLFCISWKSFENVNL